MFCSTPWASPDSAAASATRDSWASGTRRPSVTWSVRCSVLDPAAAIWKRSMSLGWKVYWTTASYRSPTDSGAFLRRRSSWHSRMALRLCWWKRERCRGSAVQTAWDNYRDCRSRSAADLPSSWVSREEIAARWSNYLSTSPTQSGWEENAFFLTATLVGSLISPISSLSWLFSPRRQVAAEILLCFPRVGGPRARIFTAENGAKRN